jgi:FMN phosphatase YigB (HAD superfamily)
MVLKVKWCGFDWGECIMNADDVRNAILYGDLCKKLGRPELIAEKMGRHRVLKEKYGRYPVLQEGHRDEIFEYVLEKDKAAIEFLKITEQELFGTADNLEEALVHLKKEGIETAVVTEMKYSRNPLGSDRISRFLKRRNLDQYFDDLITPLGKVTIGTNALDLRYKGTTKAKGNIYNVLAEDLMERGIETHEAVMVGDRPSTDINPPHKRGFKTIQYTGFSHQGKSEADVVISSFGELKTILQKRH